MFSSEANGYNKQEVDNKIRELTDEIVSLQVAISEKNKLNYGLANALEKSKEIELSTKNLYDLKMQKIQIFYKSLEKSLNSLFMLYPQIEELENIKRILEKFSRTLQSACAELTENKSTNSVSSTEGNTLQVILKKMNSINNSSSPIDSTVKIIRKDSPLHTQKTQVKRNILSVHSTNDGIKTPAEQFLEDDNVENNAYAKLLNTANASSLYPTPNESGFDLKEAVNPKQDLDEIMKAFNFKDDID